MRTFSPHRIKVLLQQSVRICIEVKTGHARSFDALNLLQPETRLALDHFLDRLQGVSAEQYLN